MTKDELLARFSELGVNPPSGASKTELDQAYRELVRNIKTVEHPLVGKLTKEDHATADLMISEAASHDQVVIDVEGG